MGKRGLGWGSRFPGGLDELVCWHLGWQSVRLGIWAFCLRALDYGWDVNFWFDCITTYPDFHDTGHNCFYVDQLSRCI